MSMPPFGSQPERSGTGPTTTSSTFGHLEPYSRNVPELDLFGPNSPLAQQPKKKFDWKPWAIGAVAVLVVGGITFAVSGNSDDDKAAPAAATTTTPLVPSPDDAKTRFLPVAADMPTGWMEDSGSEKAALGADVGTTPDCTAAYAKYFSAAQAAPAFARANFAGPTPSPVPAPPPPPPPPGLPPAPPAPPIQLSAPELYTQVRAYADEATAKSQFQLITDSFLKCPSYTDAVGTRITMTEGDDTDALGDESEFYHLETSVPGKMSYHGLYWISRAGNKIWQMEFDYFGNYQRDQAKTMIHKAVTKWRSSIN